MLTLILSLFGVFLILVASEYLWQNRVLRGERARKFVHVLVGMFVASWPWYMSWRQIQLVSIVFLVTVWLSKRYKLFHALQSVRRRTLGEATFALGIGLCALLTTNKIFFAVAIMHMALADAAAALVGKIYGYRWRYTVMGQVKTVIGSMAFWLVSLWILGVGLLFSADLLSYQNYVLALLFIPPLVTFIESLAPWGLDNALVPVAVILVLNGLA